MSVNGRAYLGAISSQPVRTLRREFYGWLLHLPSNGTAWCSLRGVVVEWGCSGWQHCVPPWLLAHSRELRSTVFIVFCSAPNGIQKADCLDFACGITNNYVRKKVLRLKLTVLVLSTLYTFVTIETVMKLLSWATRKLVNHLYWLDFRILRWTTTLKIQKCDIMLHFLQLRVWVLNWNFHHKIQFKIR